MERPLSNLRESKLLFLDRDGVINIDHGYVHRADQTEWVSGIFDFCRAARRAGYGLVVVTNQAGIARGYYSEDSFRQYTRWVHEQFVEQDAPLLATYYCPHHPDAGVGEWRIECDCRKPKPGMLRAASADFGVPLSQCILLGDKPSDIDAAKAAGLTRYYLVNDKLPDPEFVFRSG
jgi:D-glycero-D-manno-heptose 1,7-bisphosphate phosphatase